ncbi:MAG: FAD-binding protein [Clostridiales Family XIII bacterium]|jgi:succinate dehydrogenase/fumarate reductase flavoprotein subunit|nr:FAD-binding protein [Clostridiales Family XIII bacterium]
MEFRQYLASNHKLEWPYPIKYGEETRVDADVLVIGGGLAGSFAAISATAAGARVIIADKAPIVRSGSAGPGIDHWSRCNTNPCAAYAPDEMLEVNPPDPYSAAHVNYIAMNEAWACAKELESYGLVIRDENDEYAGAAYRDPETKLMFAYDYAAKDVLRLKGGEQLKPILYREMKRIGVEMYERVFVTKLLTEGGRSGGRVIGATGFSTRTGEFFVFNAKSTVMATANPVRLWAFASENIGSGAHEYDPHLDGDGNVMAWDAGAKLMMMERSHSGSGGRRYPSYMTGNSDNTWYGCIMVDADGKEIPWVDRDGKRLNTFDERIARAPGQRYWSPGGAKNPYRIRGPHSIADLEERILSGEYKLPFFADMTRMSDTERRGIFGLMLGAEGKTKIPVVETLTNAGFDPERDMLMANVLHPKYAGIPSEPYWDVKTAGVNGPNIRETSFLNYGGLLVDWDLRSSLKGLYAAGNQIAGASGASVAASTGRYAGRAAAAWAEACKAASPAETQIAAEKERVYAYARRDKGYGWKEIQIGLCRIMQDYCGDIKSKEVLEMGLWWLDSIRENELARAMAANPHELGRILGCTVRLAVNEIIIRQCLARESSSEALGFARSDFPRDGDADGQHLVISRRDGTTLVERVPFDYCASEGTPRECYAKHSRL